VECGKKGKKLRTTKIRIMGIAEMQCLKKIVFNEACFFN
jgi:hypothetical protein